MPRLLILCEYPTVLGGERSMMSTLDSVAAAGYDVHVAAPSSGPLAEAITSRGIPLLEWSTRDESGIRKPLERLREDLAQLLRRSRPDMAHANSLSTARIAGPVTHDEIIPSLGHIRDIVKLSPQAVADVNRHRRLVAVSRATRDFHVSHGIDARKCFAVHNGIDLDEFRPRPASGYLHRELNVPPAARLVAVIGQIGMRKGVDVALSAALQISHDHPDVHWLVVGERSSEKEEAVDLERLLQEIASEPPLAGRVHFVGARNDMPTLLNECTLLLHAARQEPLARVLLEAAASGVAVVATDVGGTREIFPQESSGAALVPANDPVSLAAAMARLLTCCSRREALARAARLRAEGAFDVRIAAARLIEHYQAVL